MYEITGDLYNSVIGGALSPKQAVSGFNTQFQDELDDLFAQ
jgi:hypothetical protein